MKKEKNIIAPIAGIMVALTILNIGFAYGISKYNLNKSVEENPAINKLIEENNIKTYGSKANFEKAKLMNALQYDLLALETKDMTEKDFINRINQERRKNGLPMVEGTDYEFPKISKEDLVANTPIYGKKEAKFSIYEFSDFECPYCRNYHNSGVAKKLVDENPGELNYIKRNFQFHSGAPMKAGASLCAIEQKGDEGYFSMMDAIFAGTLRETKEEVLAMAEKNGLDKAKLEECINSGKYEKALANDYNLGQKMGVTGTPSVFLVNNETGAYERFQGRTSEEFKEAIKNMN